MLENIPQYVEAFKSLSIPIEYKSIKMHPFTVSQWYDFYCTVDILTIEKNQTPDIKIIQMSYLQYIIEELFTDNENGDLWKQKFYILIHQSTNVDIDKIRILIDKNNKYALDIDGVILNPTEFNEFRRILLYQNIYDYDDAEMSADFRKAWNEYLEVKNRGMQSPSLQLKMSTIQSQCGFIRSDILKMTLIEFEEIFNSCLTWEEYKINKTAEMSGRVKFNKQVEHPVWHKKHDKYRDMFVDADDYARKLTSV